MTSKPDGLVTKLLKAGSLRVTPIRKRLLEYFLLSDTALTPVELEAHFGKDADRVTLYRNLHAFHENGLLHRIMDAEGQQRFALERNPSRSLLEERPAHVHFHCLDCGKVQCLFDVTIATSPLPVGFSLKELSATASGTCRECALR